MNITFKLTNAEVKGIRKYLHETSSDINPKITNQDIKDFVISEAGAGILHAPQSAVSWYIAEEEKRERMRKSLNTLYQIQ